MAERNENLEKAMHNGRIAIKGQITHVDTGLVYGHPFRGGPDGLCLHVLFHGEGGRRDRPCDLPRGGHGR